MRLCASFVICLLLPWLPPCKRAEPVKAETGLVDRAVERIAQVQRRVGRETAGDGFLYDGARWIDPTVPPHGYVRMTAQAQLTHTAGNALLLLDESKERFVPIFVGNSEALSIRLRLAGRRYPRPLTHDLLDRMLEELDADVVSVQVDELRDNVFIGTVVLGKDDRSMVRIDARPSDAVALAVGNDAPIFVAESVLEAAGRRVDELESEQDPSDESRPPATQL